MKRNKDGRQPYCRVCTAAYHQDHVTNSPNRKSDLKATKRKAIERNQGYVDQYLRDHPCVDCGNDDPIVLEFDHIAERGKKLAGVSSLVHTGCALQRVIDEIAKCDVRCANCHRKVTASRYWHQRLALNMAANDLVWAERHLDYIGTIPEWVKRHHGVVDKPVDSCTVNPE